MSTIHGNRKKIKIEDLIKYANKKEYNVPPSIAIIIKACWINYTKSKTLLKLFHDIKIEDDVNLKSATIKLIRIKERNDKFIEEKSDKKYISDILSNFGRVSDDIENDRELIKYLTDNYEAGNNSLSPPEKCIIANIKNIIGQIITVPGLFELEYTIEDIRYLSPVKDKQENKDHVVELQIINEICHECNYDLTKAAAFAQHFNKEFNIEELSFEDNQEKGIAVRQWLNGDITVEITDIINKIKSKYWKNYRPKLCESITNTKEDFHKAREELDQFMSEDDYLLRQDQTVTKGPEFDYGMADIRYLTLSTYNQPQMDHVVELQIINKVCRDCKYDLTKAFEFAQHFNKDFNLQILNYRDNVEKNKAVTQWLNDEITNATIERMKSKYRDNIRQNVHDNIRTDQKLTYFKCAIAKLDKLMEMQNNLSQGSTQMRL